MNAKMNRFSRPVRWIASTGLATACTIGAVAAISAATAASGASEPNSAPSTEALVSALAQDYKALARPASAGNLAEDRPLSATKLAEQIPGLLPASGREIDRNDARTLILTARTDGQVCLEALFADGAAGTNCNPVGETPALITYGRAFGVVPNSVNSVTFTLTDGSSVTRTPDNNGLWSAPAEAKTLTYVYNSDLKTVDLMPASNKPSNIKTPAL